MKHVPPNFLVFPLCEMMQCWNSHYIVHPSALLDCSVLTLGKLGFSVLIGWYLCVYVTLSQIHSIKGLVIMLSEAWQFHFTGLCLDLVWF